MPLSSSLKIRVKMETQHQSICICSIYISYVCGAARRAGVVTEVTARRSKYGEGGERGESKGGRVEGKERGNSQ